MSMRRPLPDKFSCGAKLDKRFVAGERVYKFDNVSSVLLFRLRINNPCDYSFHSS
ncbi:unnamed protein product [Anisakis simplex]|uniref:MSP domain-containing protein n=1 Tax=Anisakis simplex TaxID=6269 RepID=A0A0M3JMF7_ANISI|nr:unnamed protein product [Anisakis simplex]